MHRGRIVLLWLLMAATGLAHPDEEFELARDRLLPALLRDGRPGGLFDRWVQLHLDHGRRAEMESILRERVAAEPTAAGHRVLALLAQQRGRIDEARQQLVAAEELSPEDAPTHRLRAELEAAAGEIEAAEQAWRRALPRSTPRDRPEIWRDLGVLLLRHDRRDAARECFAAMATTADDDRYRLVEAAELLRDAGDAAAARDTWRRAIALAPDDLALSWQATDAILHTHLEEGARGEALKIGVEWLPRLEAGSWQRARLLDSMERAHVDAGALDAWIAVLRAQLAERPQDLALRGDLADTLGRHQAFDEALALWEEVVAVSPGRLDLRGREIEAALRAGRREHATQRCRELARLAADRPQEKLRAAAWRLAAAGDEVAEAVADVRAWCDEIVQARPEDDTWLQRVASTLEQSARQLPAEAKAQRPDLLDDAEAAWKRAIAVAADPVPALESLAELYRARGARDAGLDTLWRCVEGERGTPDALLRLSRRFRAWKDEDSRQRSLQRARSLDPTHREVVRELVAMHLEARRRREAQDAFDILRDLCFAQTAEDPDRWRRRAFLLDLQQEIWTLGNVIWHRRARELESQKYEGDDEVMRLWTLAALYRGSPDLAGAIPPMRQARDLALDSAALHEEWAATLASVGRQRDAAQAWREAADRFPELAVEYLELGTRSAIAAGSWPLAEELADQRLRLRPDVDGLLLRAELARTRGQHDDASLLLHRALRLDPEHLETRLELAALLQDAGRPAEALEHTWAAFEDPDSARLDLVESLLELAEAASRRALLQERLRRAASREYPPDHFHLALLTVLRHEQRPADALEIARQMLRTRPDHVGARQAAADLCEESGDLQGALAHLEHLHSIAPDEVVPLRLADLFVRTGQLDRARAFWEEHLQGRGDPEDLLAQIDNSAQAGHYEQARALAQVGTMMREEDGRFAYRLGLLQFAGGHWRDARQTCLRTLHLLPDEPEQFAPPARTAVSEIPRLLPAAAAASFQFQGGGGIQPLELEPGLQVLRVSVESQAVLLTLDDQAYFAPTPKRWPAFPSLDDGLTRRLGLGLERLPARVAALKAGETAGGLELPSNQNPDVMHRVAGHLWFLCSRELGDLDDALASLEDASCGALLAGALSAVEPEAALVLARRAEQLDSDDERSHAARLRVLAEPPELPVLRAVLPDIVRSVAWFGARHPRTRPDLLQTFHYLCSDAGIPDAARDWVEELLAGPPGPLESHVPFLVQYGDGARIEEVSRRLRELAASGDPEARLRAHLHALGEQLAMDLDFHLQGLRLVRERDLEAARRTEIERRVVRARDDASVELIEYHFPCETRAWPALAVHALRQLVTLSTREGWTEQLARELQRRADRDDDDALGWQVAQAWTSWWTGRPRDGLARLERLHHLHPTDASLSLALARGFLLQDQPAIAAEYVARAELHAEVYLPRLRSLSRDVYSDLVLSDPGVVADALDHLLRHSWRPEVVQAVFPPWSEVTGGWTRSEVELALHLSRFAPRARPTARHLSVHPLPEVLEHCTTRTLERLHEALRARLETTRPDHAFRALHALVALRLDAEDAEEALEAWRSSPRPPAVHALSEPDAWWVVDAALQRRPRGETARAAWRDFMVRAQTRSPAALQAALRARVARRDAAVTLTLDDLWIVAGESAEVTEADAEEGPEARRRLVRSWSEGLSELDGPEAREWWRGHDVRPVSLREPEVSRRPNVIVLLVDDWGWTDAGCCGSDLYLTPNIDRLAEDGVRFRQAYAACTVCSPTRAAMMTGQYPARLRVTDWIPGHARKNAPLSPPDWTQRLEHRHTTLAEALRDAGYRTLHAGKWHLTPRDPDPAVVAPYYPEHHGFEINLAGNQWGAPGSYFWPFVRRESDQGLNRRIANFPEGGAEGTYLTDLLTDAVLAQIEEWKDEEFFVYFPYYNVHTPLQAPAAEVEAAQARVVEDGRHRHPTYAAMVQAVDRSLGRLRAKLEELGLADDTVLLMTGDNGGLDNQGRPTDNAPLRAGKGSAYEGGVRVPAFVAGPGVVEPGRVCDEPIHTIDFLPTVLQIAGVAAPPDEGVDGLSLLPLLRAERERLDRDALYWHYPHYHPGGARPYSAIRSGRWRLVHFYETDRVELYDLEADLSESTDLAMAEPERAAELRARLDRWRAEVSAQDPVPNPAREQPDEDGGR